MSEFQEGFRCGFGDKSFLVTFIFPIFRELSNFPPFFHFASVQRTHDISFNCTLYETYAPREKSQTMG